MEVKETDKQGQGQGEIKKDRGTLGFRVRVRVSRTSPRFFLLKFVVTYACRSFCTSS